MEFDSELLRLTLVLEFLNQLAFVCLFHGFCPENGTILDLKGS